MQERLPTQRRSRPDRWGRWRDGVHGRRLRRFSGKESGAGGAEVGGQGGVGGDDIIAACAATPPGGITCVKGLELWLCEPVFSELLDRCTQCVDGACAPTAPCPPAVYDSSIDCAGDCSSVMTKCAESGPTVHLVEPAEYKPSTAVVRTPPATQAIGCPTGDRATIESPSTAPSRRSWPAGSWSVSDAPVESACADVGHITV